MKIIAIETSCDDTGVAVIEASGKESPHFNLLSNIVASQIKIHKKWGGVYPTLAKREHQKNLMPSFLTALKKSKLLKKNKSLRKISKEEKKIIGEILFREPELNKKLITFLKKYQKPEVDLIAVTAGPGLEPCLWVGVNFAKAISFFWNIPIIPVNHIEGHILINWLKPINKDMPFYMIYRNYGNIPKKRNRLGEINSNPKARLQSRSCCYCD
jgi:N6-L-threonylcarbamoyladenine synthase